MPGIGRELAGHPPALQGCVAQWIRHDSAEVRQSGGFRKSLQRAALLQGALVGSLEAAEIGEWLNASAEKKALSVDNYSVRNRNRNIQSSPLEFLRWFLGAICRV